MFWLNSGGYNNLTARKFVLRLSEAALVEAVEAATRAGAPVRPAAGETAAGLARRLAPFLVDVSVDPMVTQKTPGPGGDILRDSGNNLYAGVTETDLDGFEERYPLNSRLVKQDGGLVEEVYRTTGRYGAELSRIVRHLEAAMPLATPAFAAALAALVQWYRSGEDTDRIAFDIAWVKATDSPVDTMNGFIEVYMDARGIKGAWEGLVYYINVEDLAHPAARRAGAVGQGADANRPGLPQAGGAGRDRHRHRRGGGSRRFRTDHPDRRQPAQRPACPRGPRQQVGHAVERLRGLRAQHHRRVPPRFTWDDAEFARAKLWGATAGELATEIHEVLGHGSGRMDEGVTAQPQELLEGRSSALEETRADLVALYFCADPRLAELDIVPASTTPRIVRTEYEAFARTSLVQLRRVREGTQLEEDHMRNRQAIVHWLLAHTDAISVRIRDGRTFHVLESVERFRQGVGEMLREVQRIESEGDYPAARALFETYGVHFDPELRNEIVGRVDRLNLPSVHRLRDADADPGARPGGRGHRRADVGPRPFAEQMLGYSAERRRGWGPGQDWRLAAGAAAAAVDHAVTLSRCASRRRERAGLAPMLTLLILAAALGAATIGGVFFAFSTFVMRALGQLPPAQGIAAMQRINVVVLNPMFLGTFVGTAVLQGLVALLALGGWGSRSSTCS